MKFHDVTIVAGSVHSERLQDTTALVPAAIDVTRGMLEKLRDGQRSVRPSISGVPEFDVTLGLPDEMASFHSTAEDAARAPDLFSASQAWALRYRSNTTSCFRAGQDPQNSRRWSSARL